MRKKLYYDFPRKNLLNLEKFVQFRSNLPKFGKLFLGKYQLYDTKSRSAQEVEHSELGTSEINTMKNNKLSSHLNQHINFLHKK